MRLLITLRLWLRAAFVPPVVALAMAQVSAAQGVVTLTQGGKRILGVYNLQTGAPVESAQVLDIKGGLSALTTRTGTVILSFIDTLGALVEIRKIGYRPTMIYIANSARDTVPATLILEPVAYELPMSVTNARALRGPGDTVRKLELNGFYDRRANSAAPSSAFATEEAFEHLMKVSDIRNLTGRQICAENLYIDGIRITKSADFKPFWLAPNSPLPANLRVGDEDQLLNPLHVAAIEQYTGPEVPAAYRTVIASTHATAKCATLIWTR